MSRCYPDLESIQQCIEVVRQNEGDERYNGIYPDNEAQLPRARKELAAYFREVWDDFIHAAEVELAQVELDPEAIAQYAIASMAGKENTSRS